MRNILVIDDEYPIREWLSRTIRSHFSDCHVESAINGLDALRKLDDIDYHLVISDIRMQQLDGIGLLEQMQNHYPRVGIIVLSSYDDYEYVRSAFKFHATDYLLKAEINEERLIHAINHFFTSYYQNSNSETLSQFIAGAVIQNNIEDKAFRESTLSENMPEHDYFCFLTKAESYDSSGIKQYVPVDDSLLLRFYVPVTNEISMGCAEFHCQPSRLLQMQSQFAFCSELQKCNRLALVVSSPVTAGPEKLLYLLKQLYIHRNIDFYGKSVYILGYHPQNMDADVEDLYTVLLQATTSSEMINILHEVDKFCTVLEQYTYPNIDFLKSAMVNVCEHVSRFICAKEHGGTHIATLTSNIQGSNHIGQLKDIVKQYISEEQSSMPLIEARGSERIQKVLKYLEQNYMKPLSLSSVAEHAQVNPEYLSRLFKRNMNVNFNAYLCDLRLHKALELIQGSNKRIQDIAYAVGFQSFAYFSKCFKVQYGVSPLEWRSSKKDTP